MKEKQIKELVKNFKMVSLDVYSIFPSEEEVLKEFYKKNNLSKPTRTLKTSIGLVALFEKKDFVMISREDSEDNLNPRLEPFVGGDGSAEYTSQETNYTLEGKLSGKDILLEGKISYTETYKEVPTKLPLPMVQTTLEKTGENNKYISREDDNKKYWFLK